VKTRTTTKAKKSDCVSVPIKYGWVLLGMLLIAGLWLTCENRIYFPIETVRIEASYQHVSPHAIKQAILPYVYDGFFGMNVGKIKQSVSQLPWVDSVSVQRIWPGTLHVKIREHHAVAIWNDASVLNTHGNIVVSDNQQMPAHIPHLQGPMDEYPLVWQNFLKMNVIVRHLGLQISRLVLSDRHAWVLRLNNGMELLLGRFDVLSRLQRFASVYGNIFNSAGTAPVSVDLRYKNGLAVNRGHA